MTRFGAFSRSSALRRLQTFASAVLVVIPQSLALQSPALPSARAECGCGAPAAVAAPTQTYRLDYQTVYDERQVTANRVTYETVSGTCTGV